VVAFAERADELVLQVGDRLTDASVAARLDQLRRQVLVK